MIHRAVTIQPSLTGTMPNFGVAQTIPKIPNVDRRRDDAHYEALGNITMACAGALEQLRVPSRKYTGYPGYEGPPSFRVRKRFHRGARAFCRVSS